MTTSQARRSSSIVLGGVAVAASLLLTAPAAVANGDAMTACIGPGGEIIHASVGDEPWKRCPPNHVQKTWALSGQRGAPGTSCWDLDEDGVADPEEDFNQDGVVDVRDCRPAEVYQQPTERTWYVASGALLAAAGYPDDGHHMNFYSCDIFDEIEESCVVDPAPDPCGLWYWDKEVGGSELWYLRPTRGYQYENLRLQDFNTQDNEDPADDSFGWENCLGSCVNDPQCVGASITESGEDAIVCRLIAKSQFDDPVIDEYAHITGFTRDNWATLLYAWEWNFSTAVRDTVISVCPAETP